jgi:TIR domain
MNISITCTAAAKYCIVFASASYAAKVWPSHERRSAQARALEENREYILPARFDDTEIPGLRKTVGYIDLEDVTPKELADLIGEKIGPRQTSNFFPPEPDRLYEWLDLTTDAERSTTHHLAWRFFHVLQRMSEEEKSVLLPLMLDGCPAELPENVHMSLDLLRRETGRPRSEILELLGSIRALGFTVLLKDREPDDEHELMPDDQLVVLSWCNLTDVFDGEPTEVAYMMCRCVVDQYCALHGMEALMRLDFAQLASATSTEHVHESVEAAEHEA